MDLAIKLIVLLPLLAAAIAGLLCRVIGDRPAQIVTCAALLIAAALSIFVFVRIGFGLEKLLVVPLFSWIDSGTLDINWSLRVDTLTRYGLAESLKEKFPDKDARDAEMRRIASAWADSFDANSLFILGRAMDSFNVARHYDRIKVPVLYVLSRTDVLFPPDLAPGVMAGLRGAGVDATYEEIDSVHSHLASGTDAGKWAPALRAFIRKLEANT